MANTHNVGDKAPLGLFLRSQPTPKVEATKIALLPMGHGVEKLGNAAGAAGWWEVSTQLDGATLNGFVNSSFLTPIAQFVAPAPVSGIKAVHLESSKSVTRNGLRHPFALNEANQPTRDLNATPADKARKLTAIVNWLDVENKARYQPTANSTYCNIYAYDYCYLAGVFLPRVWWRGQALLDLKAGKSVVPVYEKTVTEINANTIFVWLSDFGPGFGWKRSFDLDEMQQAANNGRPVIICAQNKVPNKSGHICPVVPETSSQTAVRDSGGKVIRPLTSQAGRNNHKYQTDNWWTRLSSTFRAHGFWINS